MFLVTNENMGLCLYMSKNTNVRQNTRPHTDTSLDMSSSSIFTLFNFLTRIDLSIYLPSNVEMNKSEKQVFF